MVKGSNSSKVTKGGKKNNRKIIREEIFRMSETKSKQTELAELTLTPFTEGTLPAGIENGLQVYQLNDIARGSQIAQRIGNSIHVTGVSMRGLLHGRGLTIDGSTSHSAVYVRHAVLKQKSASIGLSGSTTPLFLKNNDVLTYDNATNVNRFTLPFNHKDFDIMFQRTEKLGIVNTGSTQNYWNNKLVKFYNRYNIKCDWADGDGTASELCNPGIYYIVFVGNLNMDDSSDSADTASLGCAEVNMNLQLYYKDM